GARGGKHERGVLEAARERETILYRHMHIGERDVRLPDRTLGYLPCHDLGIEAGCSLLNQEATHVAFIVAGPDDGNVGERSVANPTLAFIDDVLVDDAMLSSHA